MEPVSKKKEMEIKSVWANGENVIGQIETVLSPTEELPYWRITLKDGSFVHITGQVIVKWGPKNLFEKLSDKELLNGIEKVDKLDRGKS